MTYSAGYSEIVPPMVGPFTLGWSMFAQEHVQGSDAASSSGSGDVVFYHPVLVPQTCVVRRLWWANGSSVSASYNIDAGVYADAGFKPGAKLVSTGSTAQGNATQVQFVDVTDTTLSPGLYWLAIVANASATLFRTSGSGAGIDAAWRFIETSAPILPDTATPVECDQWSCYVFGFATTATP